MRVLHVDTEPGFRGGQRQVALLCRGLRDRGVEGAVVARTGAPLAARCRAEGIAVHEVRQAAPWDPRPVHALRRLLRQRRIDVVHAHASHALGSAVAALASVPAGHRPPLVATRRVDFPISGGPKYGPRVARFVAISRAVATVLERGGVEPARIAVVHSGVPPRSPAARPREVVRRELGLRPETTVALTTAALVDHKDHPTAIRALAVCGGDVHLVIAGDGPLRGSLRRLVQELGVGARVSLIGARDDVPDLLAAADLYLSASHLEGLGTAVLDAGLAGLPVVATAAGGVPEAIEHDRTGLLVPPRDPAALGAAIDRLVADPTLRRRLGRAAAEHVASRFSVDRMVEGTVQAYREVLEA